MTARFHKSWADFGGLKPYAALEYETSQMMAHGARCSIGDQLHPRGVLDQAAYELIGKVYERVEEREPWLDGARPVAQIGVVQVASARRLLRRRRRRRRRRADAHAAQAPVRRGGSSRKLEKYDLLILPDAVQVDARAGGATAGVPARAAGRSWPADRAA